ncbi:hypothetical protein CRYUN_Cryun09bG0216800 [Craigia yunnanensis]
MIVRTGLFRSPPSRVMTDYWGHGIATKAVKWAASQFFVDFPNVARLEAFVDVNNKGSQRVVEKAGEVLSPDLFCFYLQAFPSLAATSAVIFSFACTYFPPFPQPPSTLSSFYTHRRSHPPPLLNQLWLSLPRQLQPRPKKPQSPP